MKKKKKTKNKVLVIGDTILDEDVHGKVSRISPEAPVMILDEEKKEFYPGGALNVACNISSLSRKDDELGIDYFGFFTSDLYTQLLARNIECKGVSFLDPNALMIKTRYVSNGHQLLRVDNFKKYKQSQIQTLYNIFKDVNLDQYDVIVISDYNKGTVSESILSSIFWSNFRGKIFFDFKVRKDGIFKFLENKNCVIKCNEIESEELHEALEYYSTVDAQIVVTMGSDGYEIGGTKYPSLVPASQAVNVTGAGDSFLAGMVVKYLEDKKSTLEDQCAFGNQAAGHAVLRKGTVTVQRSWLDE